jgi:hypothetical protein
MLKKISSICFGSLFIFDLNRFFLSKMLGKCRDDTTENNCVSNKVCIVFFGRQVKPTSVRCFLGNANGPLHMSDVDIEYPL